MITPGMNDDEKRSVLLDMTYEDLQTEIMSGRLTWQEFDLLLPEIGAVIGATVMYEESLATKEATKPIRPHLYGVSESSAPFQAPQKPTTYHSPEKSEEPQDDPADSEVVKLRRAVERILKAQETTNSLLADILKELKRR